MQRKSSSLVFYPGLTNLGRLTERGMHGLGSPGYKSYPRATFAGTNRTPMSKSRTDFILDYFRKIRSANKELTKKEAFKDLLNRLYAGDADIVKIVDAISAGAEATVLNIPRKDKIHRGSADTLYNRVIIEFENDLRKTLPHAKEQLAGYMLGQFRSGRGYDFILIASDFVN